MAPLDGSDGKGSAPDAHGCPEDGSSSGQPSTTHDAAIVQRAGEILALLPGIARREAIRLALLELGYPVKVEKPALD